MPSRAVLLAPLRSSTTMFSPDLSLLAAFDISNPATPWITLALVIAGWVAAYLFVSAGPRP